MCLHKGDIKMDQAISSDTHSAPSAESLVPESFSVQWALAPTCSDPHLTKPGSTLRALHPGRHLASCSPAALLLKQAHAIRLLATLSTPKGWAAEWRRIQRDVARPGHWRSL